MKKEWIRVGILFLVTVGLVFWALNYLFLNKQAPTSRAGGETVALAYNPTSVTAETNKDFSIALTIKPSTNMTLRGYRVNIDFDRTKLQLKNIDYKIGVASPGLGDTTATVSTVNQKGNLLLVGEAQATTGQLLSGGATTNLVQLTFTSLSTAGTSFKIFAGDATFYIFGNDGAIYEVPIAEAAQFNVNGGGAIITPGLTGTTTPIPTTTIPVTGNTKLYLNLKFQGITAKPADARNSMNVKFSLSGGDLTTPQVKSGTFKSDASGIWTGGVGFDLTSPAGKKYVLYVKGPRHVQKKICDIAPVEGTPGTYSCSNDNFTLATGDNSRDLSKILLLSGDIYGPNKVQDGVVNSVDLSYVKNNLNKTDGTVLAVCDINLDGKCDTQDYSLIISSLSIKSDEQ